MRPAKSTMTVLKQAVELIPAYLVSKLASKAWGGEEEPLI
jgi:hypothetical protein